MADPLTLARKYLLPPRNSFWEWQDIGEAVTWADGRTIVFRTELARILERLAPSGLPSLGALLLLMSATRDGWGESPTETGILADCLNEWKSHSVWKNVKESLNETCEELQRIHLMDPALRQPTEAKCILAETVFQGDANRTSADEAKIIVDYIRHGIREVIGEPYSQPTIPSALLKDLQFLQTRLPGIDESQLWIRQETGLDWLPGAADLDVPPALRIRVLLDELKEDTELSGLARLANRLMATVSLPRSMADHDELQIGGVSDITNRGPLDRLLLSELAHDDFVLTTRVAMNEALYLRRESPPRSPQRQRCILLDSGIRSWGVPRVYSTAVAMAFTATTVTETNVIAFRAKGEGITPVNLTNRNGLVSHLSVLETELHPGNALEAFMESVEQSEHAAEPVVIVSEDVFDDKEFRRCLTECMLPRLHIATVNRNGRFQLFEQTARGRKLTREAELDLDELFKESIIPKPSLIDREWARNLPAIFSVEPFPLLLPHNIDVNRMWHQEGIGVLAATRDGRLMLWAGKNQGAIQLSDNVPRGQLWWTSSRPFDGVQRAIIGTGGSDVFSLLTIDLDHRQVQVDLLDFDAGVQTVCSHNGALFAVNRKYIKVYTEHSGEFLQRLDLPSRMSHSRGRFFKRAPEGPWFALSYDGRTARLETVLDEKAKKCPKLHALFDSVSTDGPLGITELGDLYSTSTGRLQKISHGLPSVSRVLGFARDGSRFALESSSGSPLHGGRQSVVVDNESLEIYRGKFDKQLMTESGFHSYVCPRNVRHKFSHIRLDNTGRLTLTSRKQQHFAIAFSPERNRIALRRVAVTVLSFPSLTFSEFPIKHKSSHRLWRAKWEDGSEAFLDSRGLLHLRSSDSSHPEVSIVLTDEELSGWCSDGRFWGDSYFIGVCESTSPGEIYESVIGGFTERLR